MCSYDSICNVFFLSNISFDGSHFLADYEHLRFIRILHFKDKASTLINLQQEFVVCYKVFFLDNVYSSI